MSSSITSSPVHSLGDNTEFVLAENLEDQRGNLEVRLTFYRKHRQIDEKKVLASVFGCVQVWIPEQEGSTKALTASALKLGDVLLKPRYNNLDHHETNPGPMSGAYVPCLSGETASLLRLFYRDYRAKVPAALAQIPEEQD